jgi:hypothetical protein
MSGPDIDVADLHPDLQPFFKAEGPLVVDHPLLRMFSESATKINGEYERRCNSVRQHFRAKEWVSLLDTFEGPYQLLAFGVVSEEMTDSEYWEILRSAWMSTENPFQYLGLCVRLFSSPRTSKDRLMCESERTTFESLPQEIKIYRGYSPEFQNCRGISWTLKKEIAKRLGGRRGRYMAGEDAEIREETVKKDEIVAFMNLRDEEEIIYLGDFHERDGKDDARTEGLIAVIRNCLGI